MMRSPEYSGTNRTRPEAEYYQYLSPESFTVLPPDENTPTPSPPLVPEPYKLTPRTKRRKNQAFAIIAEPNSPINSRAGSPTGGRVSPFRGRGFNPSGSRHASPAPSPPPPESPSDSISSSSKKLHQQQQLQQQQQRVSQIPKPVRRRSSAEDLLSPDTSPTSQQRVYTRYQDDGTSSSNLSSKYSKSMTNITPRHLNAKPPPSPRRNSTLKSSFVRLSPIIGSSPEAGSDNAQSSPSRIPRSKSQPPSRLVSPSRPVSRSDASRSPSRPPVRSPGRYNNSSSSGVSSRPVSRNASSRTPSRTPSRPASRNASRNASRETSPTGRSPTKIPMKNSSYKHIPAKVDSYNRQAAAAAAKPKVPQKPKIYSTRTSTVDRSKTSTYRKNTGKTSSGMNSASARDTEETETTDTERETSIRSNAKSSSSRGAGRSENTSSYGHHSKQYGSRYDASDKGASSSKMPEKSRGDNEKSSSSGYNSKPGSKHNDRMTPKGDSSNGHSSKQNPQSSRRKFDNGAKGNSSRIADTTTTDDFTKTEDEDTMEEGRDDEILSVTIDNIVGPSTTQIVSATTETVVKPLNIETKLVKPAAAAAAAAANAATAAGAAADVGNSGSETGRQESQKVSSPPKSATNPQKPNENPVGAKGNSEAPNGDKPLAASRPTPVNNPHGPANGSLVNTPKVSSTDPKSHSSPNPPTSAVTSSNGTTPVNSKTPQVTGESINNNVKQVTNSLTPSLNSVDMNIKNSLHSLTPPDSDKVNMTLVDSSRLTNSAKVKQSRTVIVDEIKPIKITVREKSGDVEVQSGNYALPRSATNGISERPLISPNNPPQNVSEPPPAEEEKKSGCGKFLGCCSKTKASPAAVGEAPIQQDQHSIEHEKPQKCWEKMCCKGNKVSDSNKSSGCFPKWKKDNEANWAERRDSILSEPPKKQGCFASMKRILCCVPCCAKCKRKPEPESVSRRTSMMSKKKSLSSTMQPPPEKVKIKEPIKRKDNGPKLDTSLVDYTSHMRGAIPVLPVPLAWVCLICNVFLPGFGTILSGLFCLCIGIPRFSQRDGARARIGAFLIDVIVGISQMFTVLFCLVGWGWSIWWGVIMLKTAKKHRKIKRLERNQIEQMEQNVPSVNVNNVERGSRR